jgi:hypothetical protein
MATQAINTKPNTSTAQWAVETDGAFCVLAGLLFMLDANGISQIMGVPSSTTIGVLGAVTLLYGLGLFYDVFKGLISANVLRALMVLDFVGAVVSVVFLVAFPTALSTEGRWVVLILADVMAAFGIWKVVGLRRLTR